MGKNTQERQQFIISNLRKEGEIGEEENELKDKENKLDKAS